MVSTEMGYGATKKDRKTETNRGKERDREREEGTERGEASREFFVILCEYGCFYQIMLDLWTLIRMYRMPQQS